MAAGPAGGCRGAGPFSAPQLRRLTTAGEARIAALSPDGRLLAYALRESGQDSLLVRQVATGEEVPILPATKSQLESLWFTSDANFIYYTLCDGEPRLVLKDAGNVRPSPDGRRLSGIRESREAGEQSVILANADGTELRALVRRAPPEHFDGDPAWSPDGTRLAVVGHSFGEGAVARVIVIDTGDGHEVPIPSAPLQFIGSLAWLPDGDSLLVTGSEQGEIFGRSQIWRLPVNGGPIQPVTNDLNSYLGLSLSGDGRSLVSVQGEVRSAIDIGPADGPASSFKSIVPESMARPGSRFLIWSSDGRLIHSMAREGLDQIRLTHPDTGEGTWLTQDDFAYNGLGTYREGGPLLVSAERNGAMDAWKVDPESGRGERLTQIGLAWRPALLPDSGALVYLSWGPGGPQLIQAPAGDGQPEPLLDMPVFHHELSPDGESLAIAYQPSPQEPLRLGLLNLVTGDLTSFPDAPMAATSFFMSLNWSRDGGLITWLGQEDGDSRLWAQPVGGGPPRLLLAFPGKNYEHSAHPRTAMSSCFRTQRPPASSPPIPASRRSRRTSGASARSGPPARPGSPPPRHPSDPGR